MARATTAAASKLSTTEQGPSSSKSKFVPPDPNTDYWKLYQDAIKASPKNGADDVSSSLLFRVTLWLRAKAPPMTDDIANKLYDLFLVHLRKRLYFQQDAIHDLLAWYTPKNDIERVNKLMQPLIKEAQAGKKMRLESKAWILVTLIKQGNEAKARQVLGPPETTWVPYFSDFEKWTRGSLSPAELERARQVLYEYQDKRLQPNSERFTHLLLTLFSRGKPEDALALYEDTLNLGFPTSELVASAMLNGLLNAGKTDDAEALWQRLRSTTAYHPTIATYNNLLSALSQNPKRLDVAEDLWRYVATPESQVRPDLYTFSHMLNAYFRAHREENALELWRSMRAPPFEIEPTLVLYNTVLTGLFRTHRPDLAKLEFEQMMTRLKEERRLMSGSRKKKNKQQQQQGRKSGGHVRLDEDTQEEDLVTTFNIMLKGLISVRDLAGVHLVRDKMMEFDIEPNLETYTLVSDVLFSQRDVRSALKTVDIMTANGVEKSAITYSSLIAGLVKANELERAFEAFEDMKRAGFAPTVHVYGALIQGAMQRGNLQLAEEMAAQGKQITKDGQLSAGAYGILIGHYTELNRLDRAMDWFLEMSCTTPRQKISWTSYYVLLRACVEHKDWSRAQQVIRVMDANNFHPGVPRLAPLIAQVNRESTLQRTAAGPSSSKRQ